MREPVSGTPGPMSTTPISANAKLALFATALGASVVPLDTSVNVAFPIIRASLDIALSDIRFVVICYVLTYGSLLLGFGRIADVFGHRRVFIAGLALSLFSLSFCAVATTFLELLCARVLQGISAAMILSAAPALATLSLSEGQRSQGVAIYMLGFSLATAVGPALGGFLVGTWGWPAVFWYRVPIAAIAIGLAVWRVPSTTSSSSLQHVDLLSISALTLALVALLSAIALIGQPRASTPTSIGLLALGTLAMRYSLSRQRDSRTRILDFTLFRQRVFASVNVSHVLVNGASFMIMLLVPFHLAAALGGTGTMSGLIFAMSPLGFVIAAPICAKVLRQANPLTVGVVGLTFNALGLFAISNWSPEVSPHLAGATLLVQGLGYGLFQVSTLDYVMSRIPRAQHGAAGGLNTLTRTIGVVLGLGLGTTLFAVLGGNQSDPGQAAFQSAFAGVFLAAALIVAAVGPLLVMVRRG